MRGISNLTHNYLQFGEHFEHTLGIVSLLGDGVVWQIQTRQVLKLLLNNRITMRIQSIKEGRPRLNNSWFILEGVLTRSSRSAKSLRRLFANLMVMSYLYLRRFFNSLPGSLLSAISIYKTTNKRGKYSYFIFWANKYIHSGLVSVLLLLRRQNTNSCQPNLSSRQIRIWIYRLTLWRLAAVGKLTSDLRPVLFIESSSRLVNSSRNLQSSSVNCTKVNSSKIRLLNYNKQPSIHQGYCSLTE